jgi:hypothetical protein
MIEPKVAWHNTRIKNLERGGGLMADEPTDLSEERRMIEPKHGARPMADVIYRSLDRQRASRR